MNETQPNDAPQNESQRNVAPKPTETPTEFQPLLTFSTAELTAFLKDLGLPGYRAAQIRRWVFARKTFDFAQMSDLSKDVRAKLAAIFAPPTPAGNADKMPRLPLLFENGVEKEPEPSEKLAENAAKRAPETTIFEGKIVAKSVSDDGTEKLLLEWRDGRRVECVLLRDDRSHRTACVSVQVGCAMNCAFCASGLGGFVRNLTKSEILEEILRLNALLPTDERLTHIVVMGTGEPTLNLDALLPALSEATATDGLDLGNRKVTISTVGIPAGIRKLAAANVPYKLAVSLHAPNDRIRDVIMPQNRIHPIAEVLSAADVFFRSTGRRVTFEYVLLDGINSTPNDARELARLLRDKTAIVNVIPYNPAPELSFKTPSPATVRRFVETLEDAGIQVKARFRKGDKINAACGQLRWSLRDKNIDDF